MLGQRVGPIWPKSPATADILSWTQIRSCLHWSVRQSGTRRKGSNTPILLGPRKAVGAGRGRAVWAGSGSPSCYAPWPPTDKLSWTGVTCCRPWWPLQTCHADTKVDTPRFCSVRVRRLEQNGGLFGHAPSPRLVHASCPADILSWSAWRPSRLGQNVPVLPSNWITRRCDESRTICPGFPACGFASEQVDSTDVRGIPAFDFAARGFKWARSALGSRQHDEGAAGHFVLEAFQLIFQSAVTPFSVVQWLDHTDEIEQGMTGTEVRDPSCDNYRLRSSVLFPP